MNNYYFTTQAQVRAAFWQGNEHLKKYVKGKTQNEYGATMRSEFVEFVDMLERCGSISPDLANKVTL